MFFCYGHALQALLRDCLVSQSANETGVASDPSSTAGIGLLGVAVAMRAHFEEDLSFSLHCFAVFAR